MRLLNGCRCADRMIICRLFLVDHRTLAVANESPIRRQPLLIEEAIGTALIKLVTNRFDPIGL